MVQLTISTSELNQMQWFNIGDQINDFSIINYIIEKKRKEKIAVLIYRQIRLEILFELLNRI